MRIEKHLLYLSAREGDVGMVFIGSPMGEPTTYAVLMNEHNSAGKWFIAGFATDGTNDEEDFALVLSLCILKFGDPRDY